MIHMCVVSLPFPSLWELIFSKEPRVKRWVRQDPSRDGEMDIYEGSKGQIWAEDDSERGKLGGGGGQETGMKADA